MPSLITLTPISSVRVSPETVVRGLTQESEACRMESLCARIKFAGDQGALGWAG